MSFWPLVILLPEKMWFLKTGYGKVLGYTKGSKLLCFGQHTSIFIRNSASLRSHRNNLLLSDLPLFPYLAHLNVVLSISTPSVALILSPLSSRVITLQACFSPCCPVQFLLHASYKSGNYRVCIMPSLNLFLTYICGRNCNRSNVQ